MDNGEIFTELVILLLKDLRNSKSEDSYKVIDQRKLDLRQK